MAIESSRIRTFLWFADEAEEAAELYTSIFPDSGIDRVWTMQASSPSGPPGSVKVVEFHLFGQTFEAMSAGGRVIVGSISFSARADDSSFVWDRKHGMRHLRTILEGYGVALPDGWIVVAVNDVSDDARVLAGSLKKPGSALLTTQAFRVVLPANAFD